MCAEATVWYGALQYAAVRCGSLMSGTHAIKSAEGVGFRYCYGSVRFSTVH